MKDKDGNAMQSFQVADAFVEIYKEPYNKDDPGSKVRVVPAATGVASVLHYNIAVDPGTGAVSLWDKYKWAKRDGSGWKVTKPWEW